MRTDIGDGLTRIRRLLVGCALALGCTLAWANAVVPGISGPNFNLVTGTATISTPDGDSLLVWVYGDGVNPVQLPGPTLIVEQGQTVTVNLTNTLAQPVSIVFPGQGKVTATGGKPGLLTREACSPSDTAPCGGTNTVSYSFVASLPGTYVYHSGTNTELQVEMGLYGAIIVRPAGFDQNTNRTAYGHPGTAYDHEYLFLLSEMDPFIHDLVDFGFPEFIDNTTANPVFWFINGRNGVDTLFGDGTPSHPNQPYGALARTRPGEKVLLRIVNVGRNPHSFHPHGNHSIMVARDGRMLESAPGAGPDLATAEFTFTPMPGGTIDAIFNWTSKGLGWDIYGDPNEPGFAHTCNGLSAPSNAIDPATGEDCNYHGVRLDSKVVLPGLQDLSFGGWYSGSPFLGHFGQLPPGEGGLNLNGGLFFMWHSHQEKELTNFDIFPGGMLTFVIIEPPGTPIP
jgi:FtsP/CotA-like multicopper oxidase with cupredoxin domain